MAGKILFYMFYGLISGLSEFLPVPAAAQGYLLEELSALDTRHPLMLLMIHLASLVVVLVQYRHRIRHLCWEMYLAYSKNNRRPPDRLTVLDGQVALLSCVPTVMMLAFSDVAYRNWTNLFSLSIVLLLGGIVIYTPQFQPAANRDSRHLTPIEVLLLGLCAGAAVLPGISRIGVFLSMGLLLGCDRRYILDIAILSSIPALLMMLVLDAVSLFAFGLTGINAAMMVQCALAAVMAFVGAWLSMVIIRYLNATGTTGGLAYYSWALALLSFILYLVV